MGVAPRLSRRGPAFKVGRTQKEHQNGPSTLRSTTHTPHGVAVIAVFLKNKKNHRRSWGFGPFLRGEQTFFRGVLRGSEALCHKVYVESRPVSQVAIHWHTTTYCANSDGQNPGNLYNSYMHGPSLSGHWCPDRSAASTADPDDSLRSCSTNIVRAGQPEGVMRQTARWMRSTHQKSLHDHSTWRRSWRRSGRLPRKTWKERQAGRKPP